MDFPLQTKLSKQCPDKAPFLCGQRTPARGLCVKTRKQCKVRTSTLRNVPVPTEENTKGKNFGYLEDDLGRSCYLSPSNLKLDYHETYPDGEHVPDNFSCLSYNIWGLAKDTKLKGLFSMRQPILEKTLKDTKADILCLQEMSTWAYDELDKTNFFSTYKFQSEKPLTFKKEERNRGLEVFLLSKYKPSSVSIYGFKGVLGYSNSVMIVTYPNLVIYNLYNQAGSKYSPGQEHKWLHYSRCRYDILNSIYDIFQKNHKNNNCILLGDFNFDLDGTDKDWPEKVMLNKFMRSNFVDTYRNLYPNVKKYPCFTEDTEINLMRYNQKLIEKMVRFDGVFFRSVDKKQKIKSSKMIGLEPRCLNKDETIWFLENMAGSKNIDDLRTCKPGHLSIHPSDHFGILTTFG